MGSRFVLQRDVNFVFGTIYLMTWREFIQHNIDKLILLAMLHGMVAVMMNTHDISLIEWIRVEAAGVIGALLMLITGRATKPEPTATTTVTAETTIKPEVPAESAKGTA